MLLYSLIVETAIQYKDQPLTCLISTQNPFKGTLTPFKGTLPPLKGRPSESSGQAAAKATAGLKLAPREVAPCLRQSAGLCSPQNEWVPFLGVRVLRDHSILGPTELPVSFFEVCLRSCFDSGGLLGM